ncbi:cytochrome C [Roseiarcaceae bacterium H3SJ34-1]|uniref:c-type cytochrome n=1 Tax=Terripilifer ovatus TaxID=3032367 RepID=UPI003AB988AE|nr:cytochrome C [Roseiarcaceae bacterium H3SJ34-1]
MPLRFLLAAILMCACGHGAWAEGLDAPAGALSCSGCHPASANVQTPAPGIVGRNADDLVASLLAFKNGKTPATVMDRVAKGFTDDEIRAIASWYAARKD